MCGSAPATSPSRAGRTMAAHRRALYHQPPIAWSMDKASYLHDFPDKDIAGLPHQIHAYRSVNALPGMPFCRLRHADRHL